MPDAICRILAGRDDERGLGNVTPLPGRLQPKGGTAQAGFEPRFVCNHALEGSDMRHFRISQQETIQVETDGSVKIREIAPGDLPIEKISPQCIRADRRSGAADLDGRAHSTQRVGKRNDAAVCSTTLNNIQRRRSKETKTHSSVYYVSDSSIYPLDAIVCLMDARSARYNTVRFLSERRMSHDSPQPKAVCLLSGGLDSSTCLAIARQQGFKCYCLSFDYGQRHRVELEAAARIARSLGACERRVAHIDLRVFGKSALTDEIDVPKGREAHEMNRGIPVTYVPARNTIFLSFALAYAEVLEASDIFIGVNAIDYSGYPDCRPEFVRSFEAMGNLATKAGVEGRTRLQIHMPLISMSKADIVRKAVELGVDLSLTHSCYDPDALGRPCGECDSCLLRKKGFAEAGVHDPLVYRDAALQR